MMKKFMLLFVSVLLIVSATGCSGGGNSDGSSGEGSADETFVWKLQSSYGPGDQTWDIQMPMLVEAIETASEGRIKIETYIPSSICEPEQAPASVANGLLECAISAPGDTGIIVPAAYAEQGIPFHWETGWDQYESFYDYGLLEYLREEYEKAGIYYGMPVPNGAYGLMTTFAVNSANDVKGSKIRASSSYGEFVQQLGGSPVVMPGGDIYMGLKLGTINGCIYTIAELKNAKLEEVVDYIMVQPGSGSAPVNFIINQKAWNALPEDLQEKVNQAMEQVFAPIYEAGVAYDNEAVESAKEAGVEFIEVSQENMTDFWDAGEKTADLIVEKYPSSAKGIEILKQWHKEVKE